MFKKIAKKTIVLFLSFMMVIQVIPFSMYDCFSYADTSGGSETSAGAEELPLYPVGGRIYFVNKTINNGKYTFYNINKNKLELSDDQKNNPAYLADAAYYTVENYTGTPNPGQLQKKYKAYALTAPSTNRTTAQIYNAPIIGYPYVLPIGKGGDITYQGEDGKLNMRNAMYDIRNRTSVSPNTLFAKIEMARRNGFNECYDWYMPGQQELKQALGKNNSKYGDMSRIYSSVQTATSTWQGSYMRAHIKGNSLTFSDAAPSKTLNSIMIRDFGLPSNLVEFWCGDTYLGDDTFDYGSKINVNGKFIKGYTINAWYTNPELTEPWNFENILDKAGERIKLYADGSANALALPDKTVEIKTKQSAQTIALNTTTQGSDWYTYSILEQSADAGFTITQQNWMQKPTAPAATLNIPADILPGTYKVKIRATDRITETTGDGTYTITVDKGDGAFTLKNGSTTVADNSTIQISNKNVTKLTVSAPTGKVSVSVSDDSIVDVTCDAATNITITPNMDINTDKEVSFTVTTEENERYHAKTVTYTLALHRATLTVTPGTVNFQHDGNSHALQLKANEDGATVYYSATDDSTYDLGPVTLANKNTLYSLNDEAACITNIGSKTIYYKVTCNGYYDYIGSAVLYVGDTVAPTVEIDSTNEVADKQTITLKAEDTDEVDKYYFGTNSNGEVKDSPDLDSGKLEKEIEIDQPNTYYLIATDKAGNKATTSITFYRTKFKIDFGDVDIDSVLTESGKEFKVPKIRPYTESGLDTVYEWTVEETGNFVSNEGMYQVNGNYTLTAGNGKLYPVGGRIYYVNTSINDATYTFFDINKDKIELTEAEKNDVTKLENAAYYAVSDYTGKLPGNKYWAYALKNPKTDRTTALTYNGSIITLKGALPNLCQDGEKNTRSGLYEPRDTLLADSTRLFARAQTLRRNGTNECYDWFIPSENEWKTGMAKGHGIGIMNLAWGHTNVWSSTRHSNYMRICVAGNSDHFKDYGGANKSNTAFIRNFGLPANLVVFQCGNQVMGEDTFDYGSKISVHSNFTKGYTINGWYTDPELTQPWDLATDTLKTVGEKIILYADGFSNTLVVNDKTIDNLRVKQTAQTVSLSGSTTGGSGWYTYKILEQSANAGFSITQQNWLDTNSIPKLNIPADIIAGTYTIKIEATDRITASTGVGTYTLNIAKGIGAVTIKNDKITVAPGGKIIVLQPGTSALDAISPTGNISVTISDDSLATLTCDNIKKKIYVTPEQLEAGTLAETEITVNTEENERYLASSTQYILSFHPDDIEIELGELNFEYDAEPHGLEIKVKNLGGAEAYFSISDDSCNIGPITFENYDEFYMLGTNLTSADPALLTECGSKTIYYKFAADGYYELTGNATITVEDTTSPDVEIESTNDLANKQKVTFAAYDLLGISGYYFGTNPNGTPNETEGIDPEDKSLSRTVEISADGTYYLIAKDTTGHTSSDSITFYKTDLTVENGSVEPQAILTESGQEFTLPEISADVGYSAPDKWSDGTEQGGFYTVAGNSELKAECVPNELEFLDQTFTIKTSLDSQNIGIIEATNGTGEYTYSMQSQEPNGGFTFEGNKIVVPANITTGQYDIVISAQDTNSNVSAEATYRIIVLYDFDGNIELDNDELNLTYPEKETVYILNDVTGCVLSAESDRPDIATVELSGNAINISSGTTSGEAHIKLSAETTDSLHTSAEATILVNVSLGSFTITPMPYTGQYDGRAHYASIESDLPNVELLYGTNMTYGHSVTLKKANQVYSLGEITLSNPGTQEIYYKATKAGYNDVTGSASIKISDKIKPTAKITAMSDASPIQTLTLEGKDNVGIKKYYFGTSSDGIPNREWQGKPEIDAESGIQSETETMHISVYDEGTYYFITEDGVGNKSDTAKITLYRTTFKVTNGIENNIVEKNGEKYRYIDYISGNDTYVNWVPTNYNSTTDVINKKQVLRGASGEADYYGFTLERSGNALIDLRPVVKLDGTIGMLDMVTGTFYPNGGDGEFGKASTSSVLLENGESFALPTISADSDFEAPAKWSNGDAPGTSFYVSGNKTLTAVCKNIIPPTVSVESTDDLSGKQTVTLSASDNAGVTAYYWGTDEEGTPTQTDGISGGALKRKVEVDEAGTYYLRVTDEDENIESTNITFYKTTFSVTNGSSSISKVIKENGKSFALPTISANAGYVAPTTWSNGDTPGTNYEATANADLTAFCAAKTYSITNATPEASAASCNGYLEVSSSASCGSIVLVTTSANSGYVLDTLKYIISGDSSQNITKIGGVYAFTMPPSDVIVKATFRVESQPTPGGVDAESERNTEKASLVAGEETKEIDVKVEDGIAKIPEIGKNEIKKVSKAIDKRDANSIIIKIQKEGIIGVELTKTTLKNILKVLKSNDINDDSFKIVILGATMDLSIKALESIMTQATGDTVVFIVSKTTDADLNSSQINALSKYKVSMTFDVRVESGGKEIHNLDGGKVEIGLKSVTKKKKNNKVYYVDEKGNMKRHATKRVKNIIRFVTSHFSDYAVIYNAEREILLLRAKTSGSKAIKLYWNEIENAEKYVVYGTRCGNSYKKLKTVKGRAYEVQKISGKKLQAHQPYKFYLVAYDSIGNAISSKTIHFITANTYGKFANVKSIKTKTKKLTLGVGENKRIKSTYKIYSEKKHLKRTHGSTLKYCSTNPNVVKVSKSGRVTAISPGKATVYIQDIGSKYCKTKIVVK